MTNFGHPNPPDVGILTGNADSADAMLRIQAVVQLPQESLLINLLDMSENGTAGQSVTVTANGSVILSGFAGSTVTSLNITVNNYAGLVQMIRNAYSGRLVDVLDVKM